MGKSYIETVGELSHNQEGMIITARKNRKSTGGEQKVFCVGGGREGNEKARFGWEQACFLRIYLRCEDFAGVLFCLRSVWSTSTL